MNRLASAKLATSSSSRLRKNSLVHRPKPLDSTIFVGRSKEPRPSGRAFLNQEDFYSSATLRAAIPPRSSERGILADPREAIGSMREQSGLHPAALFS